MKASHSMVGLEAGGEIPFAVISCRRKGPTIM
jgi:hypothetical protein